MVTAMNFMHVRSTVGLAKQIRRISRRMKRYISDNPYKKPLKDSELTGDVSGVKKTWESMIHFQSIEEDDLSKMTKDALIILHEEENTEHKEYVSIKKLADEKDLDAALVEKIKKGPFNDLVKVNKIISDKTNEIRVDLKRVLFDKEGVIHFKTLRNDKSITRQIKKLAKKVASLEKTEGQESKEILALSKKITKDLNSLHSKAKNVSSLKKELNTYVDELVKFVNENAKHLKKEVEILMNLIHYVAIILVHVVIEIGADNDFEIELDKEGFPKKILGEMDAERKQIADKMHSDLVYLYKLARYDQRSA